MLRLDENKLIPAVLDNDRGVPAMVERSLHEIVRNAHDEWMRLLRWLPGDWESVSAQLSVAIGLACAVVLAVSFGLAVVSGALGHGLANGVVQGPGQGLSVDAVDLLPGTVGTMQTGDPAVSLRSWARFSRNGRISFEGLFKEGGRFLVTVVGKGSPLNGVGPVLRLRLDGGDQGDRELGSQWSSRDWVVEVPTGVHTLELAYINDAASGGEDRTAEIQSISVRSLSSAAVPDVPLSSPFWTAFQKRETPSWYGNAKFGIFVHWGVYSVPAWAPKGSLTEWYQYLLRTGDRAVAQHQKETFGEDSRYEDFARDFRAQAFDPASWSRLFKKAGARYVVFTARHHDGYCNWPAPMSDGWNSVDTGPHKDLTGELSRAVKAEGLRFGIYYSLGEWFSEESRTDPAAYARDINIPQLRSLVDRYKPSLLWADGPWRLQDTDDGTKFEPLWSDTLATPDFLAWATKVDPTLLVNDRWGGEVIGRGGDYVTIETYSYEDVPVDGRPWEGIRTLGTSFGYRKHDTYPSPDTYILDLIQIASRGGNMLLNVGPTPQGTIARPQREILTEIGKWMRRNGSSIYGTRAGLIQDPSWYYNTSMPDAMYVFLTSWPKSGRIDIDLPGYSVIGAKMLSTREPLDVRGRGTLAQQVTVELPKDAPGDAVPVVEVSIEKILRHARD